MPVNPNTLNATMSGPVPGQSLTTPPKSMPWEKPPQFTKLEDAMHFLMDQMLDPQYYKQLAGLMDAGMPIEAITRTLIFSGFSMGKWNPDLGMLMYKPLMLSLIAIAHRAGFTHTPIVMKESLDKYLSNKLNTFRMFEEKKLQDSQSQALPEEDQNQEQPQMAASGGFMRRRY